MRRRDAWVPRLAAIGLVGLTLAAGAADDPGWRFHAPIQIEQPAPLIRLALPVSAYAHSRQPELRDLRVVDARGERVPFALLAPRAAEVTSTEQRRDASMYALPARPSAGGEWVSPVEVSVQGDRISVKRRGGPGAAPGGAGTAARSGGWLFDLGERKPQDPPDHSLQLAWSGPAEFSAGFELQTSADLRRWRGAGNGQLLALVSAGGPLTQPAVMLPGDAARFVRLVWSDPAAAPVLIRAEVVSKAPRSTPLDPPTELVVGPSAASQASDADARRALEFDLGAVLPVVLLDLQLGPGTRVAPLRIEGRDRSDAPWRALASAVFYRFERDPAPSVSPPLALRTDVRFLRVIPDPRSAALQSAQTRLAVQAALASVVFAAQGQAPYALWAGSAAPAPGAFPVAALVPQLDEERPRFGRATIGAWAEVAAVARQADSAERLAALRPWLLWAVLIAGVAGLGFMVWRLTRAPAAGA